MLNREDIQIRDPYVLKVESESKYYLYGTTDEDCWRGKATGFNAYCSEDLENFEGPFEVFHTDANFWADQNFWAPEVYHYNNKYFMFASFKSEGICRGTQILVSDSPKGPFIPHSDKPVTPANWECLDGTLFVDEKGQPWMVFCHEWVQVFDGEMWVMKLTKDLKASGSEPVLLFRASDAPWTNGRIHELAIEGKNIEKRVYVTDGPFVYKTENGQLLMLWSSGGKEGYAMGIARSTSGSILGPWVHDEKPLYSKDGGHGMLFKTFEGNLILTIHTPNKTPKERPVFLNIYEDNGKIFLKGRNKNMLQKLFSKKFIFGSSSQENEYINITNNTLYTQELGYGFVTEVVKEKNELLQIPELGGNFELETSLIGQQISNILMDGCCYSDKSDVPLSFKAKIPHNGNYNIKLIMGNKNVDMVVSVFSQRRRCVLKNAIVKAGQLLEHTFTANVSDIIPRGKTEVYEDDGIYISILGSNSCINSLTIEESIDTATIYIAGDSTVTDQVATYPYNPSDTYCGWAQMFPLFLKQGISVSNHSHSGLTTDSFRRAGHFSIVEKNIKPKDIFFMQFGHNDQKDKTLDAFGGYADNLRRYVDEIKSKGAYPVIVTPVSRTIWNGPEGAFNDMLKEYAAACIKVAGEKDVPLIDLHGKSVDFILKHGAKNSAKYFHLKDYTHHNDFGAFEMAKLVVEGINEAKLWDILKYLRVILEDKIEIEQLSNWVEPTDEDVKEEFKQWSQANVWAQKVDIPKYTDIESHFAEKDIEEVVSRGIMSGDKENFNPENGLMRVEFLDIMLKTFRYSPANVYNDVFDDVFGDEWYAGIVQASYDYGIIPTSIIVNNNLKPEEPITIGEVADIVKTAYKLKKNISANWMEDIESDKNIKITRGYAASVIKKLLDTL